MGLNRHFINRLGGKFLYKIASGIKTFSELRDRLRFEISLSREPTFSIIELQQTIGPNPIGKSLVAKAKLQLLDSAVYSTAQRKHAQTTAATTMCYFERKY